ncbi:receptor activity-modifying protein 1 [Tupaia chinensis]|uniref:receptor activity-modifying protein 1 n=1 Tax=Tupaia chinensis TaxID=246437 RepID=UPI0003C910DD|nr:receptor activity-modifying protein 1 [Tupaia chinensis]
METFFIHQKRRTFPGERGHSGMTGQPASLAHHLFAVTACQDADFGTLAQEHCLARFESDMEAVGEPLWCDWAKTIGSYKELTDCTRQVAERLQCFWPNAAVDRLFLAVHRHYFRKCPVSGRAVRDPPSTVLCPFIVVPITVTLMVTALVVWRSKHTEGIV